jgi:hypothetical protein
VWPNTELLPASVTDMPSTPTQSSADDRRIWHTTKLRQLTDSLFPYDSRVTRTRIFRTGLCQFPTRSRSLARAIY